MTEDSAAPNLAAFLRTQLDEDERAARAASLAPWYASAHDYDDAVYDASDNVVAAFATGDNETVFPMDSADVRHIARHDPARVLRDVEAARRILDIHAPTEMGAGEDDCARCGTGWPCDTVRAIAVVYADQPPPVTSFRDP